MAEILSIFDDKYIDLIYLEIFVIQFASFASTSCLVCLCVCELCIGHTKANDMSERVVRIFHCLLHLLMDGSILHSGYIHQNRTFADEQ